MPVDIIVVLLIILALVLMWRGPKTLPKWGETLGQAVRGVRQEADKMQTGIEKRLDEGNEPDGDRRPPS
jgi:Sec-independent protein translocase protein TatA